MNLTYIEIKNNRQIWKFSLYGFLKNLRFFEPYLLLYLLDAHLSLFQIGLLFSIREFIVYFFEIPSGVIADKLGNRKELVSCFIFYIFSFVLFALGNHFYYYALAMIFYGFGEAFRSGTHKSMIMSYLEQKNWFAYKSFVYGRTRSFSLLGSALSAVFSIVFIWYFNSIKFLFYISIIPYIIDFFLILSYPKTLDNAGGNKTGFTDFFKDSWASLKSIWKQKYVLRIVMSSASFEAIFKSLKDYIQPIVKILLAGSLSFLFIKSKSPDENLKFLLGLFYALIYIFSSLASRNAFRLRKILPAAKLMNSIFLSFAFLTILLAISISRNQLWVIAFLFLLLFILQNLRRPFFVDIIGDFLKKEERATVLSIESQSKSVFLIILSPIVGLIADNFGLTWLFAGMSVLIFVFYKIIKL